MSETRRPMSAAARLLGSLLVFATTALPPAAAAQVAAVAFQPPAAFFAPPPLAELEAHGRELTLHLAGGRTARLDLIAARVETLAARLAEAPQSIAEPDRVREAIERVRVLLARALGRSANAAEPGRPREALTGAAAGTLRAAAAGAPAWIFDGAVARSPSALAAPPAGAAAPAAYAPIARRLPSGFGSDLRIHVPAPYAAAEAAPSPTPRREADGGKVVRLSPRLARVTDAAGQVVSYEAGVADLLLANDAEARTALSRSIARELLSALRKPDPEGASTRQLGDFLRDIAEYRPADAVSARLSADGRNHFRLIFERADKSRRVILGQFLAGSARDGKPQSLAFVLMGPIEIDAAGTPRQSHAGYWREYTGDGRLDWSGMTETSEKGWGPWKRKDEVESSWRTARSWRDGGWSVDSKEKMKTAAAREGLSWFGRAGEKIMATPVVGHTLKFCDNVAASLYTSVIGAPQIIMADLAGSDMYSLEAGGSYAKNPFVNLFADDEAHLSRLTPGARRELYRTVDANRRRALDAGLFPLAPELRRQALDAPVSSKEAVATLRDGYGASTYGRRMLAAAEDLDGWGATAMKAGGLAAGAFENVAEGVANPILWVTLGAGEAAAALKGSAAVASGAIGAKAALTAVTAVHAGATAAWWAPWILSGSDNLGKVAQLTASGSFDREYFAKLGTTGADFLYMFVIP